MHEAQFADSFHIPRFTVLGLPLLPLSIGHEIALWKRRNPIVTHTWSGFDELPADAKFAALVDAVEVCCEKTPFWLRWWARKAQKMMFHVEHAKFLEYRAAGCMDLATVKQPRQSGGQYHYFGAPELARLLNYVVFFQCQITAQHFGGSPLNFPLGLARILYSTHLECEGHIWVQNFQDVEDQKRREEFDKANPESSVAVGEDQVQVLAEKWNREHPETPVVLPRSKGEK